MIEIKNGFKQATGHIQKINEWQNCIYSKEFEVARIIADDLIEKFKNLLSAESLSILELKVIDSDKNEYPAPEKQNLSVLEYLCLVALRQHNSKKHDKDTNLRHRMVVVVPQEHILRQLPEDRIGLSVINITHMTQGLIRMDMHGKFTNDLIQLEGFYNYFK